jgi:hypothetical protein
VKAAPKSLRRKSGRKPGGQPGHPGATLALVADPNRRMRHEPGPCSGCGADLADAPEVGVERRQVFDLPPMTVQERTVPALVFRAVVFTYIALDLTPWNGLLAAGIYLRRFSRHFSVHGLLVPP